MHNNHILYLTSQFPTPHNRGGAFTVQRIKVIQGAGYKIQTVCTINRTPPKHLISDIKKSIKWIEERKSPYRSTYVESISTHYITRFEFPKPIFGWYSQLIYFWQIFKDVKTIISHFEPNIIVSSWVPSGITGCLIGKHFGIPTIVISEGSDINILPYEYHGWNFARNVLNNYADAICFVSNALKNQAIKLGLHNHRMVVIYNGADVEMFPQKGESCSMETKRILAVSELVPIKGIGFLLDALAIISKQYNRPVKLTIIGDGILKKDLLDRINNLNLKDIVEFVNPMPQRDLANYYQRADLLCVPSISESFGCVIVEAMACGTPVVASRVGGIIEIINSTNGILVPPANPEELAKAIMIALERKWNPELIRQHVVGKFTWHETGINFSHLFQEVIER